MSKSLLIVRHGERERLASALLRSPETVEPGLSELGIAQSVALAERISLALGDRISSSAAPSILVSPARRCIQTITPLAAHFSVTAEVRPELSECEITEPPEGFVARCQAFVDDWLTRGPALTIACSHHDWIGEVTRLAFGESCWLEPAGIVLLESSEGRVSIQAQPESRNSPE